MWKTLVEKLLKSELWVTLVAMGASALSGKLGIPQEHVSTFVMSMTGLAVAYIGQRGVVKYGDVRADIAPKPLPNPAPIVTP